MEQIDLKFMKTVKSYTNLRFVLQIEYCILRVPSITILTNTNLALKSPNLHSKVFQL